ncbi:MAG: hypothetical protein HZA66_17625 [Rhodopseudomonas palustris]|uniref:Uncharacterized protein n=1 Tax=Rhodopseudomonas palustris TaxID=1076 RepID=A0A933RYX2_RHOPL|nr:hypothetical protein [Rhodopseudomonas palustris]
MRLSRPFASVIAISLVITTSAFAQSSPCATDDPRQGGFFNGMCNLSNGGYERRLRARQDELSVLDKTRADLEKKLASRNLALRKLEQRISETHRHAQERRNAVAAVDAEIATLKERRRVSEAQLAAIQADNELLSQELAKHMEHTRQTELASRAIQDGALAVAAQHTVEDAEARDRKEGEQLDRRISEMRKLLARAAAQSR